MSRYLIEAMDALAAGRHEDALQLMREAIEEVERRERLHKNYVSVLHAQIGNLLARAQGTLEGMVDGVIATDINHLHQALEAVQAIGALLLDLERSAS